MENPQAQMPQGQPGMEQGQAPQQGGQDQQMQQLMQMVQQMIQQGAQPTDVAAELLGQQVPPEAIMQVFVELGLPEQEAQMAIEQAMQGGQQQQGAGEEQMEGAASNPQEEAAEGQGAPMMPPGMEGQPPMAFGGQPRRMLRKRNEGGGMDPQQELQAVMEQIQGMMDQGADARQVMEQIQAAAQQGQISPEVATQVMEQLGGMQEATNPQGSDMAMTEGSQDPQVPTSDVAAPEAQMMRFGGNLKKLMQKAYGGNAIPPTLDSKNYAQERANMFVSSVKNNAFKSSLDDEFPSLSGKQMAYGGNIPIAKDGISLVDGKLTIDPTAYKSESDYKAAVYDWNSNPNNKDNVVTSELFTANKWTEQPDQNASYKYDPNTKQYIKQAPAQNTNQFQFQEGDRLGQDAQGSYVTRKDGSMMRVPSNSQQAYNLSQSGINPVAYQDPRGNSLYDNLYMSANPWARMIAGSGNRYGDPRVTGANLPGGMSGAQFLGNVGGLNGLTTGMTGTVGDQTWKVTGAEKFKEGSIWKGNRRKGVRYNIDWGSASATNPNANTNQPTVNNNQPQQPTVNNNPANAPVNPSITVNNPGSPVLGANNQPLTSDGSNMMWNSGNMPTLQNPNPVTNANQTLVNPANSVVVQPAAEVNAGDNSKANTMVTNVTNTGGTRGVDDKGRLVGTEPEPDETQGRDKWDRRNDRQLRREARREARNPEPQPLDVSNPTPNKPVNPDLALGTRGPEVTGVNTNIAWSQNTNPKPWENAPTPPPTKQELRQDKRSLKRENRQAGRALRNMLNEDADQSQMPEIMQQAFQQQAYGGTVNRYDNGGSTVPGDNPKAKYAPFDNYGDWHLYNIDTGARPPSLSDDPKFRAVMSPVGMRDEPMFASQEEATNYMQNPVNEAAVAQWRNPQTGAAGQVQSNYYLNPNQPGTEVYPGASSNRQTRQDLSVANAPQFSFEPDANNMAGTKSYGGSINPQDLANAVALINRAFGGMIPRADNGLNVTSWDKDGNGIPDNIQSNPLGSKGQGTLEASQGKKFNMDWDAAADVYMTSGSKFANFMNGVSSFAGDQERELTKRSALNRPADTYDTMDQGMYDQWGNAKPNDLNNQVLNPGDDVYRLNQKIVYANGGNVFSYGGRLYEMGGDVELDDNELAELSAAGFNFTRS
jgi:hypothetical protein